MEGRERHREKEREREGKKEGEWEKLDVAIRMECYATPGPLCRESMNF